MIVTEKHKAALDALAQERAAGLKIEDPPITLKSLNDRITRLEKLFSGRPAPIEVGKAVRIHEPMALGLGNAPELQPDISTQIEESNG